MGPIDGMTQRQLYGDPRILASPRAGLAASQLSRLSPLPPHASRRVACWLLAACVGAARAGTLALNGKQRPSMTHREECARPQRSDADDD